MKFSNDDLTLSLQGGRGGQLKLLGTVNTPEMPPKRRVRCRRGISLGSLDPHADRLVVLPPLITALAMAP